MLPRRQPTQATKTKKWRCAYHPAHTQKKPGRTQKHNSNFGGGAKLTVTPRCQPLLCALQPTAGRGWLGKRRSRDAHTDPA